MTDLLLGGLLGALIAVIFLLVQLCVLLFALTRTHADLRHQLALLMQYEKGVVHLASLIADRVNGTTPPSWPRPDRPDPPDPH